MSDHEERKEEREERREEREQHRDEKREARKDGHHGRFLDHMEEHDTKRAHEEIGRVKDELYDILKKKEIHVHATHAWLHRLAHAAFKILRTHEDELDQAKPEANWVPDALDAIFDADKQSVALGKAIVSASGSHTAKEADFEKPEVQNALKALQLDIDKAVQLIPDGE